MDILLKIFDIVWPHNEINDHICGCPSVRHTSVYARSLDMTVLLPVTTRIPTSPCNCRRGAEVNDNIQSLDHMCGSAFMRHRFVFYMRIDLRCEYPTNWLCILFEHIFNLNGISSMYTHTNRKSASNVVNLQANTHALSLSQPEYVCPP